MSYTTTPVESMFEMQRQSIKHGQELVANGIDFQQNAAESFLHTGLAMQRSAQRQGTELARQVSNAQLDALEETVDDEEFRETVDEQFQESARRTQQLLNAQFEQGAALFQQLLHAQFDALESALDADEFDVRSSIDHQFEEFERSQQEGWDEFEAEFIATVDDLSDQQKIVLMESVTSALQTQQETEELTVESIQQFEEMAETAQHQTDEVTDSVQRGTRNVAVEATEATEDVAAEAADATGDVATEAADAIDDVATETTDTSEDAAAETTDAIEEVAERGDEASLENLQALEGVGSTYAERLAEAGIETVDDLASAEARTVAMAAEISEDRAEDWIDAAQAKE